MKKIIVFGGAGFLGSHVADALTAEGYEVTIFDINESNHLQPNQRFVRGDITDQNQIAQAIVGHDVVYNFAGIADIDEAAENPVKTITTNILGNTNVLEACRMQEIKRYVYEGLVLGLGIAEVIPSSAIIQPLPQETVSNYFKS